MQTMNLNVLQRDDKKISTIIYSAFHAAIYKFDSAKECWEKTGAEGTFFICSRTEPPLYSMVILNKLSKDNFVESISSDMEVVQENKKYLLYRKSNDYIRAIWFFNEQECDESKRIISNFIQELNRQTPENKVNSSSSANGFTSFNKPDIVWMLNKAQLKHEQQLAKPAPAQSPPEYNVRPIQVTSLMQQASSMCALLQPVVAVPCVPPPFPLLSNVTLNDLSRQPPPTSPLVNSPHKILTQIFSSSITSSKADAAAAAAAVAQQPGSSKQLQHQQHLHHQLFNVAAGAAPPSSSAFTSGPIRLPQPSLSVVESCGNLTGHALDIHSRRSLLLPDTNSKRADDFKSSSPVLLTPADFATGTDDFRPITSPLNNRNSVIEKDRLKLVILNLLKEDDELLNFICEKISSRLNNNVRTNY